MSENYEAMEEVTAVESTEGEIERFEIEETEGKTGLNPGLAAAIIGGTLALGGLAIAGVKKIKKNRAEKQDKPKTKLKFFVRVPVEDKVEEAAKTEAEEEAGKEE